MTAGIAANRPIAVANSASEMPGATTASEEFCCCADLEEAVHDAPDGAEQPDERRDRAGRGEEVEPLGERVGLGRDLAFHRQGDALARAFAVERPARCAGRALQFVEPGSGDPRRGRVCRRLPLEQRLGLAAP